MLLANPLLLNKMASALILRYVIILPFIYLPVHRLVTRPILPRCYRDYTRTSESIGKLQTYCTYIHNGDGWTGPTFNLFTSI